MMKKKLTEDEWTDVAETLARVMQKFAPTEYHRTLVAMTVKESFHANDHDAEKTAKQIAAVLDSSMWHNIWPWDPEWNDYMIAAGESERPSFDNGPSLRVVQNDD